jgi:TolA-binding protein
MVMRPSQSTHQEERSDNVSSDEGSDNEDVVEDPVVDRLMERAVYKLQKENRELKRTINDLQSEVEKLRDEAEEVRLDVIRRSQKNFDCNLDLFKRISAYTKHTLFRHIKFITSDEILDDLESKHSLANVTMKHFEVDARDRISWWRACRISVSDTIGIQRNQVAQAVKTQVLSKYPTAVRAKGDVNNNSPFSFNFYHVKQKSRKGQP